MRFHRIAEDVRLLTVVGSPRHLVEVGIPDASRKSDAAVSKFPKFKTWQPLGQGIDSGREIPRAAASPPPAEARGLPENQPLRNDAMILKI
jgi:hypothetical protein